jgi:rhamnosyltransferase subunit B
MRPVLLVPVGSWGDVNPLLWMGTVMAARGHPVTVLANGLYGEAVTGRGLDFVEVGRPEDYDRVVGSRLLWSPTMGTPFVLGIAAAATDLLYRAIEDEVCRAGEAPVLIASSLAFAARLAREKHAVPLEP